MQASNFHLREGHTCHAMPAVVNFVLFFSSGGVDGGGLSELILVASVGQ